MENDDSNLNVEQLEIGEMTKMDLVVLLEKIAQEPDVNKIQDQVEAIRLHFNKLNKEDLDKEFELFIQGGGKAESFQHVEDSLEQRFNAAFGIFKANRAKKDSVDEIQKKENLVQKQAILEELKEIIASDDSLKKIYDDFRALQDRWKDIGSVPASENSRLWNDYHFLVEKFFDKVRISRELRDIDMEKNYKAKIELCEKAEELLEEESITKAFRALQRLHKKWKEIGRVPADKKDEIWERFKAATDKINEKHRKQASESLSERTQTSTSERRARKKKVAKNIDKDGILGVVDWFEQEKGYGVIIDYFDNNEYFVHENTIGRNAQTKKLTPNAIVFFLSYFDEKRGRDSVDNVVFVEKLDHLYKVVETYYNLFITETLPLQTNSKTNRFENDIFLPSIMQWLVSSIEHEDAKMLAAHLNNILIKHDFPSDFSQQFIKTFFTLKSKSIYLRQISSTILYSIYEELFVKLFESNNPEIVFDIWNNCIGNTNGEFLIPLYYFYYSHKGFLDYLGGLLNNDNVISFTKQLLGFICRIDGEETATVLNDKHALITNKDFIISSKGSEILKDFNTFITDDKQRGLFVCLYKESYVDRMEVAKICDTISLFSINDIENLCSSQRIEEDKVCAIIAAKIVQVFTEHIGGTSLYGLSDEITALIKIGLDYQPNTFDTWSTGLIHELIEKDQKAFDFFCAYLSKGLKNILGERFQEWLSVLVKTLDERQKYILWEKDIFNEFSIDYVSNLLQDKEDDYERLKDKVVGGKLTKDNAQLILLDYFNSDNPIINRQDFQRALLHLRTAIDLSLNRVVEYSRSSGSDFYNLILWRYGVVDSFDFVTLCSKFIYFSPKDQVHIIKKLFYLADVGKFEMSVEKLSKIIRVDSDLYKEISKMHPFLAVDISTDVVIKCLERLSETGSIIYDKDVLDCILSASLIDKDADFHIGNYFDNCSGRFEYKWEGYRVQNGKIEIRDNNSYKVTVFKNVQIREYSRGQGWHYETRYNECFDSIVKAIHSIPGREWNPLQSFWEVPMEQKDSLLDLAKQFGLTMEGTKNYHMSNYTPIVSGCPSGIAYCEGRTSPTKHYIHDEAFLWCRNSPCFRVSVSYHKSDDWENYTLLDFCRILKINMDSEDEKKRLVKHGKYLTFSSIVNRINKMVDHLYCRECNEVLQPDDISNYHTHLVTHFRCTNQLCKNYQQSIYISKCFNWKCNDIIDQRDSKACPNQWFICRNCGSCCSNRTAKQRIENLYTLGLQVPQYWRDFLYNRLGHLEKREFYCYECCERAMSIGDGKFKCENCDVTYDRKLFDFQPAGNVSEYQFY